MGNQTELEYKFNAEAVSSRTFCEEIMDERPTSYENRPTFDDNFYQRGDSVVRHRLARGGELTVKERKSEFSILDRVEVNLRFSEDTDQEDVEAFLKMTGYKKLFTLRKGYVHIFEFLRAAYEIEVCMYSVHLLRPEWNNGGQYYKKFIEVEIKRTPGSDFDDDQLKGVLKTWRQLLQGRFALGSPLNESLLETYTKLVADTGTNYRI